MKDVLRRLAAGLGRCPQCMSTSFFATAISAAIALLSVLALDLVIIGATLSAAALAFGMLWIAHLAVYSSRATALVADRSRRRFVATFAKTFFLTALVTVSPRLLAQSCDCPPQYPKCVFNPARNEYWCCGANTVGCASPKQTWCCPPGSNCYGDDGRCRR